MKGLLTVVLLAVAGYFLYKNHGAASAPLVIESPVYGEMRASTVVQDREIEMVLFARASSKTDCETRARRGWESALEACGTCKLETPICRDELAPRYAKLFEDKPIPSAYLSATAGNGGERDGRLVVYGLSDEEGVAICEVMRKAIATKYSGALKCIPPSGG